MYYFLFPFNKKNSITGNSEGKEKQGKEKLFI